MEVERHALPVGMFLRVAALTAVGLVCCAMHFPFSRLSSALVRRLAPGCSRQRLLEGQSQ